jgi:predicted small lipoprotein YifL
MHRRVSFIYFAAFLVGVTLTFSACGKKGPLFIPDDAKPKSASTPSTGK